MAQCKMFKVLFESTKDEDVKTDKFYAYHQNERFAREAAMRWAKKQYPKTKIKILSVDTY